MRRLVPLLTILSFASTLILGALLVWVLARPSYWFPGAYSARDDVPRLRAELQDARREIRVLRSGLLRNGERDGDKRPYIAAVGFFCDGFRGTVSYDSSQDVPRGRLPLAPP
jgi:hypothetical protein